MPYLDGQNLFSDAQSVTASVGEHDSQNTIDLGAGAGRNLNPRARVFCQIVNDPVGASGTTFAVKLVGCDTYNGVFKDIAVTSNVSAGNLKAGYLMLEGYPELLKTNYRYLKLVYVVGTAGFTTAPKVTAGIIEDGMQHHELEH